MVRSGGACPSRLFPWTVEENPEGKVVGKILEAMHLVRGRKEEIAGRERRQRITRAEGAAAGGDDVDLVLVVRRLLIAPDRRVEANLDLVLPQDFGRDATLRKRQPARCR